jgi:hypothetical protein
MYVVRKVQKVRDTMTHGSLTSVLQFLCEIALSSTLFNTTLHHFSSLSFVNVVDDLTLYRHDELPVPYSQPIVCNLTSSGRFCRDEHRAHSRDSSGERERESNSN